MMQLSIRRSEKRPLMPSEIAVAFRTITLLKRSVRLIERLNKPLQMRLLSRTRLQESGVEYVE